MTVIVNIAQARFPYYIVRFKLIAFSLFFIFGELFPYYIVRFKPIFPNGGKKSLRSFHTTQYDLNLFSFHFCRKMKKRFHTTQYDLNHMCGRKSRGIKKSFHTTQYDLNTVNIFILNTSQKSFHTTQYDLNDTTKKENMGHGKVSILHSTI